MLKTLKHKQKQFGIFFSLIALSALLPFELRAQTHHIPKTLPKFSLKDLGDKTFTQDLIKTKGAVFIITVPNLKHAKWQDQWGRWLTRKGWGDEKPMLVFIEDLNQTKSIRDTALAHLKKRYRKDLPPFLLLDEDGSTRRAFGVQVDATVVLVVDKAGNIIDQETAEPTIAATKRLLKSIEKINPKTE